MKKTKSVSELITHTSKTLSILRQQLDERELLLSRVRAVLPARLVDEVVSAGMTERVLTLGTTRASWASRLRYVAPEIARKLGEEHGLRIERIRIRVIRPPGASPADATPQPQGRKRSARP